MNKFYAVVVVYHLDCDPSKSYLIHADYYEDAIARAVTEILKENLEYEEQLEAINTLEQSNGVNLKERSVYIAIGEPDKEFNKAKFALSYCDDTKMVNICLDVS